MAFKLLSSVAVTGVSLSIPFRKLVKDHTVTAIVTGTPTNVTVDLEGSLDDETFFTLGTGPFTSEELTAAKSMFHVTDKTVKYIRLNLTVLTGGTAPTVTALYEAFENRG